MRQCLESVTHDSRLSVTRLWLVTCVRGVAVLRESLAQSAQLEWIRCDSMRGTSAQHHHTLFHFLSPSTQNTVGSLQVRGLGVHSHPAERIRHKFNHFYFQTIKNFEVRSSPNIVRFHKHVFYCQFCVQVKSMGDSCMEYIQTCYLSTLEKKLLSVLSRVLHGHVGYWI